jgi:hypothetical protein
MHTAVRLWKQNPAAPGGVRELHLTFEIGSLHGQYGRFAAKTERFPSSASSKVKRAEPQSEPFSSPVLLA